MPRPGEILEIGLESPDPLGPDAAGRLQGVGNAWTAMGLLVTTAVVAFAWAQSHSMSAINLAMSAWVGGILFGRGMHSLAIARRLRSRS